jgi:adenylylsulfate kinase-like enzyme
MTSHQTRHLFTPYEPPLNPEIALDTVTQTPANNAHLLEQSLEVLLT